MEVSSCSLRNHPVLQGAATRHTSWSLQMEVVLYMTTLSCCYHLYEGGIQRLFAPDHTSVYSYPCHTSEAATSSGNSPEPAALAAGGLPGIAAEPRLLRLLWLPSRSMEGSEEKPPCKWHAFKPDTKRQNFCILTSHAPSFDVQHEMLQAKLHLLLWLPSHSMEGSKEMLPCTHQRMHCTSNRMSNIFTRVGFLCAACDAGGNVPVAGMAAVMLQGGRQR
jgi:hypothetical protein